MKQCQGPQLKLVVLKALVLGEGSSVMLMRCWQVDVTQILGFCNLIDTYCCVPVRLVQTFVSRRTHMTLLMSVYLEPSDTRYVMVWVSLWLIIIFENYGMVVSPQSIDMIFRSTIFSSFHERKVYDAVPKRC